MTYWHSAHICCWSMFATAILVASACGQESAKDVTAPMLASRAVTLTDLEGAKIHAKLVTEMLALREGRQGPAIQEIDWQIYMEPEGRISFSFRPTTRTARGTRAAPIRATTVKLGEPWSTDNGEAVWQFKDGELDFVRSYKGGAVRTIISLKRDGQNLTCTASSAYAREQGKRGMVLNSPIDGVPVTILSWKLVSSTCNVTR
jgi:hypothetical protein